MREIKFRAWDGGKMIEVERLEYVPAAWSVTGHAGWNVNDHLGIPRDYLMLSTGLKDKNGKEIYEGDILKIFDECYLVKFEHTESGLRVDYGYPQKHNGPAPHWVEVIGNIHENPELMSV